MIALASHSYLRLVREKVLMLGLLAVVLLLAGYYVGLQGIAGYTVPIDAISHPAGLANFLAMIVAVYLGVTLLGNDKSSGFMQVMMTKPMAPWQYLGGRVLGSLAMLATIWFVISAALIAMTFSLGESPGMFMVRYLAMAFIGQAMLFMVAVLLSQFITPLASAILVLILTDRVFVNFGDNIASYQGPTVIKAVALWMIKVIYYIVPQISAFQLWGTEKAIPLISPLDIALSVAYGISYFLLIFSLCVLVFERRDW